MNLKEITLFVRSEDGKKDYQTYRAGTSRTLLVKDGKSNARIEQIVVNDEGEVVLMCEGGGQLVYGHVAYRYPQ